MEQSIFPFVVKYEFFVRSYSDNLSYGNATEVEEDLLKQRNELRMKEWYCCVAKEQVRLVFKGHTVVPNLIRYFRT